MKKICITGGNLEAQMSALKQITTYLEEKNYVVWVANNSTFELIHSKHIPNENVTLDNFRHLALDIQLQNEHDATELAKYSHENIFVLIAGGIFELLQYTKLNDFYNLIESRNIDLDKYLIDYTAFFTFEIATSTPFFDFSTSVTADKNLDFVLTDHPLVIRCNNHSSFTDILDTLILSS